MKKSWKVCFFLFLALALSFAFTSCSTTKTIDIAEITEPVLAQRPDNSTLEIFPGPIYELKDVVANMHTYLTAWELWQNYAESLEQTIEVIDEKIGR